VRDGKTTKHLGIRLNDEQAKRLRELVADEQAKIGAYATVSASSFILGLIAKEHERRFPLRGPKKRLSPAG
jgi:hypothetical protein